MTSRSASQRRDTVNWLTSKISAATCCTKFWRSNASTIATEPNSPSANGRPRDTYSPPSRARTRTTSSVSCSESKPVVTSNRNGLSDT